MSPEHKGKARMDAFNENSQSLYFCAWWYVHSIACLCPVHCYASGKDRNIDPVLQRMQHWQVFPLQPSSLSQFLLTGRSSTVQMRGQKNTWGLSVMFYGKCITSVAAHQSCAPPHCLRLWGRWTFRAVLCIGATLPSHTMHLNSNTEFKAIQRQSAHAENTNPSLI